MAKLKSNFKNMFLSLSVICLTVALLLAQVNKITVGPIAEAKAMKLKNALNKVLPQFDNNPVEEAFMIANNEGDSILIYPAKINGDIVGYAVNSRADGFGGEIMIMVGIDADERIVNYEVLQHAETPGLGSKMDEWFKNSEKPSQSIIGRDMSVGALAVKNDGGSVDAITASTITSRAFLRAVNGAYKAYAGRETIEVVSSATVGEGDGLSGATETEEGDGISGAYETEKDESEGENGF